eukprot:6480490-Prymnesium_polylepis.1
MEVDRPLGGIRYHGVALPWRGGARLPHAHDGRASEFARRGRGWAVPPTATTTAVGAALASGARSLRSGLTKCQPRRRESGRGAIPASVRHVFTQRLGFEELQGSLPIIQRIAEATPELGLDRIMRQDVTPLRFSKRGLVTHTAVQFLD